MNWSIPLGVEVLVKKAAVDPAFRTLLVERRAEAASHIELELQPAEAAMLAAVPRAQLEAIIDRTTVPQEHRRAFLGKAAAAMVAVLGGMAPGAAAAGMGFGAGGGIRADSTPRRRPAAPRILTRTETEVCAVLADVLDRSVPQIQLETKLKDDLEATPPQLQEIRQTLQKQLRIRMRRDAVRQSETVGDLVSQVEIAQEVQQAVTDVLRRRLGLDDDVPITVDTSLERHGLNPPLAQLAMARRDLARQLRIHLDWTAFRQQKTVGDLVELVAEAVWLRQQKPERPDPPPTRGIQPDMPGGTFGIQPDMPPQRLPSQRLPSQSVRPRRLEQPPPGMGGIRP